jgi:hypothetical protein
MLKAKQEIPYKNHTIYVISMGNDVLYCAEKDEKGKSFGACSRLLEDAKKDVDHIISNKAFEIKQKKLVEQQRKQEQEEEKQMDSTFRAKHEKIVTALLKKIMNQPKNHYTSIYYRKTQDSEQKTITIKHIGGKKFWFKHSRKKAREIYYSELFEKLVTIKHNHPSGKWMWDEYRM